MKNSSGYRSLELQENDLVKNPFESDELIDTENRGRNNYTQ